MTISTVLAMTLYTPPPSTGSAMTGSDSLTIMLASNKVTSNKCPFFRIGLIFLAYSRCSLDIARVSGLKLQGQGSREPRRTVFR